MDHLPQVRGHTTLRSVFEKSSLQKALDDHFLLSEATKLVGDLLAQFGNSKNLPNGFIGAAASVMTQYPRQVVLKCVDPLCGICREINFITISDLVAWCEKHTEPLRIQVSREKRIHQQLDAREAWQNEKPTERLKEMGKAWLNRSDLIAKELSQNLIIESEANKQKALQQMETANRAIFTRECKHEGIDPERGVSPSLLKLLGRQ